MPHRRKFVVLLAAAIAWVGVAAPAQAWESKSEKVTALKNGVKFYRQATWRWQLSMGEWRTPTSYHEKWAKGIPYLRWIAKLWVNRAAQVKFKAQNRPINVSGSVYIGTKVLGTIQIRRTSAGCKWI